MSTQELIKTKIEAPETVDKFARIFSAVHKVGSEESRQMFAVESFHFMKELNEKGLSECDPISVMGCFLDVVSNGLSFASGAKHVYLMSRNVNAGTKEQPRWTKRLQFSTSPDGKIYQAERAGAIEYVTKPVMVYDGEDFAVSTNEAGDQIIRHQVKFPRTSQKIVAGYVYVVYRGGKREPFWMDLTDVERLKGYSARQNKGTANALYSSGTGGQIDPGFFGAKLINFALKNVRKSGIASQFEVNGDMGDAAILTGATQLPEVDENATFEPAMVVTPAQVSSPANATNEPF